MADSNSLLTSLVDYVNEVKPYHTKIYDFTSELQFNDTMTVTLTEDHSWQVDFQNVWTRDDVGGYLLTNVSNGQDADRRFRIPAAVFPRFSSTDHASVQTPVGDNPAPLDLVDTNGDGIPDDELPWTGGVNASHFPASQLLEYPVPLLQYQQATILTATAGPSNSVTYTYSLTFTMDHALADYFGVDHAAGDSTVYRVVVGVNTYTEFTVTPDGGQLTVTGLERTFTPNANDALLLPSAATGNEVTYASYNELRYPLFSEVRYKKTGRYAVPFHAGVRVRVDGGVKCYGTDYFVPASRDYIQFMAGAHPAMNSQIDLNIMKADRIFISYNLPFDYDGTGDQFIITIDDTYAGRVQPVVFLNSVPANSNKATITNLTVNSGATSGDVYVLTAFGPWRFQLQKVAPTVGPSTFVYFKQPYSDANLSFTIDKQWSSYYIQPDTCTYANQAAAPYDLFPYDGLYDASDYLVSLEQTSEHGNLMGTPDAAPVHFCPFGVITQALDAKGKIYYSFVLDAIPAKGSYFEIRIEQNTQFNPRCNATFGDSVRFIDLGNLVLSPVVTPSLERYLEDGTTLRLEEDGTIRTEDED